MIKYEYRSLAGTTFKGSAEHVIVRYKPKGGICVITFDEGNKVIDEVEIVAYLSFDSKYNQVSRQTYKFMCDRFTIDGTQLQ